MMNFIIEDDLSHSDTTNQVVKLDKVLENKEQISKIAYMVKTHSTKLVNDALLILIILIVLWESPLHHC